MSEHRVAIATAKLLNGALCSLGVHGLACRGRRDHDPRRGRWHRLF